MSEPARNRFALDLDDLERQLRGAAQPQRPAHAADPLAELTRIVGQDDPLKDLFARQPAGAQPIPLRRESGFEQAPQAYPQPQAYAQQQVPPAEMRGALDEFEALLRRGEHGRRDVEPRMDHVQHAVPEAQAVPARPVEADYARHPQSFDQSLDAAMEDHYARHPHDDEPALAMAEPEYDYREPEPRRSRKGLLIAAAVVTVGVIGAGAALTMRGGSRATDGKPPLIAADTGPTKVQPANPGGAEIPNQNKQIYERNADQASATKLVSREEQPVDVQQAARTMPSRGAAGGNALAMAPTAAERSSIAPPEAVLTPVPAVPGLGEPRKVRTVSIRPDGTPAPPPSASAAYSSQSVATGSTQPAAPRVMPRPAAPPAEPKVQDRAATATPPAATTPQQPLRIANVPAATPAPSAPATSAIRSGTGDFAVQLGAPGSEAEARATFAALQRKYPDQLGGQSPIIRKTELAGGKTVYRLRVGPYSRDDAGTLCTALQGAGGQCFIAKN